VCLLPLQATINSVSVLIYEALNGSTFFSYSLALGTQTANPILYPYLVITQLDGGKPTPIMDFSLDQAFHVFNMVANFAYSRWSNIYPDLKHRIVTMQAKLIAEMEAVEKKVLELYSQGHKEHAIEMATNHSFAAGDKLTKDWVKVYGELLVRHRDGFIISRDKTNKACACYYDDVDLPDNWYARIIAENGAMYSFLGGTDPHHLPTTTTADAQEIRSPTKVNKSKTKGMDSSKGKGRGGGFTPVYNEEAIM
jgi:hypothetical protein